MLVPAKELIDSLKVTDRQLRRIAQRKRWEKELLVPKDGVFPTLHIRLPDDFISENIHLLGDLIRNYTSINFNAPKMSEGADMSEGVDIPKMSEGVDMSEGADIPKMSEGVDMVDIIDEDIEVNNFDNHHESNKVVLKDCSLEKLLKCQKPNSELKFIGRAMMTEKEISYPITEYKPQEIMIITDEFLMKENEIQAPVPIKEETDSIGTSTKLIWEKARYEDKERAWLKFEITQEFIKYRIENKRKGITYNASDDSFVKKLKSGEFCREALMKLNITVLELVTLRKWERLLRTSGDIEHPFSLLENYRYCGRKSKIGIYLRNRIREISADVRNYDPDYIYNMISDELSFMDEVMPISKRTLQKMVRDFRKEPMTLALGQGKKAFKDKVKLHNVRINDIAPGELWESDAHIFNVMVKSPFYAHRNQARRFLVRPTIVAWIDVCTTTITGYRVCLNENKGAVRNSLMDGVGRFGVPKKARVDNSGAYKNVEYSPQYFYNELKGKKRLTADQKIAKRMLESGDRGLYENLGIKISFTIPGNPESKCIESFWNYCISPFEKSFPSWIGNKQENRPEFFKNLDNKTLARRYGDKFPTWDEICERLDKYIHFYNNKVRDLFQTVDEVKLSPLEVYNQEPITLLNPLRLESIARDPYIEMRVVQRSLIEKNGILYWHPAFASLIGTKIGIYYDEKNLREIIVCNEKGQIFEEKAIAIDPGLQSGDDLNALIENNRRVKISKLFYLALTDVSGSMKIEKMLNMVSKELLPLSNSKVEDEVKYLNFDDALDAIAGEEVPFIEDNSATPEAESTIDKDLMEELKKDIEGMFG